MESRLIEALAECLERLAGGESLEGCLRRYPAERAELEPLLRASETLRSVPARPSIDLAKVEQAALARAAELRVAPTTARQLPDWALPALITVLATVLIVAILALSDREPRPPTAATDTPTRAPLSTDTPSATPSATLTRTPTHTPTVTPSPPVVTVTPSATVTPTAIFLPTATAPSLPPLSPGNEDDGSGGDDGGGDGAGGGDDDGGDGEDG